MIVHKAQDLPDAPVEPNGASRVRFQVLFGSASVHPVRMGWPPPADEDDELVAHVVSALDRRAQARAAGDWYGWRLVGANNRELGRSASSFRRYPQVRLALLQLQQDADRLIRRTLASPVTGRWSWQVDLDDRAVAVSGRSYERSHDSRLGADNFIRMSVQAELADGVVTLRDRRDR